MRQIVLDTETTGLEPKQGHRIIEIGCVELINRRTTGNNYHQYINPERTIDEGALAVHGLDNDFLETKPVFADIVDEFIDYIDGAELIIHNAPFDQGFIDHELKLLSNDFKKLTKYCSIIDTLVMARQMHPGQRNSLDALCKRYNIDNSQRQLHGALLDSTILAEVYLAMTGGQTSFLLADDDKSQNKKTKKMKLESRELVDLPVIQATPGELNQHEVYLKMLNEKSDGECVWLNLEKN